MAHVRLRVSHRCCKCTRAQKQEGHRHRCAGRVHTSIVSLRSETQFLHGCEYVRQQRTLRAPLPPAASAPRPTLAPSYRCPPATRHQRRARACWKADFASSACPRYEACLLTLNPSRLLSVPIMLAATFMFDEVACDSGPLAVPLHRTPAHAQRTLAEQGGQRMVARSTNPGMVGVTLTTLFATLQTCAPVIITPTLAPTVALGCVVAALTMALALAVPGSPRILESCQGGQTLRVHSHQGKRLQ